MDISALKGHLLRLATDMVQRTQDYVAPVRSGDAQFLFGGYSWRSKRFRLWTFDYSEHDRRFAAREAVSFGARLEQVAFIGDRARGIRAELAKMMTNEGGALHLEPLGVLAKMLANAKPEDTIGGPPQVVRITEHMNTRILCVRWNDEDTLFGRPLFDYENTDYWCVDPFTGVLAPPRKFGNRPGAIGAASIELEAVQSAADDV